MIHGDAVVADIHIVHNWAVADAAALAALTPVVEDEGKVAWQLDTNDFYVLVDFAGPTWISLTIQTADAPVQSVNGDTGTVVLVAADIGYTPSGDLAATDTQTAIDELEAEKATRLYTINAQSASYTLVLTDKDEVYIRLSNASAMNLTVPLNATVAFPVGTHIPFRQTGAGQVTVVATGGVTINTPETLKLRKQWATAELIKVATDEWDLVGDLELL